MAWQEYPSNIPLQTSIGEVLLNVTSATHIYVDCNGNGRVAEVSGKPIRFSLHMTKTAQGWTVMGADGRSSLYCKKANVMTLADEATATQKEKVLAAVLPRLQGWIVDNAALLREAQLAHVNNRKDSLLDKREELEAEIRKIDKECEELDASLIYVGP